MNYDYRQTHLSKSVLAGAFAGIGATLLNLVYDQFYRHASSFGLSQLINVSTIIFGTMIVFLVAGVCYFFLSKFVRNGSGIYMIVFSVLTIYCFYLGMHFNRSDNPVEITQFRGLYLGIEAASGLLAAFSVPYLVKHSDIYC